MDKNRPRARKVTHSGSGSGVGRTGSHSSGKSGGGSFFGSSGGHSSSGSHSSSGGSSGSSYSGGGGGFRSVTRSKPGCMTIIIVLLALIFGGGGMAANGIFGNGSDYQETIQAGGGTQNGWYTNQSQNGQLNTNVSPDARARFTTIKGDGSDTMTIMVYMCGTDLESRSAMGTSDLNEMISATVGSKINLIVYTGGCKSWRNSAISSTRNQIWQISNGNIRCLVDNAGNEVMTKPETLTTFIKFTAKNFPANRNALILWDHGGGSVSGYGYDEKSPRSGSMTLSGINTALKNAGIKYDFIGFDACLMATTETALMLSNYADYMIGSEETEPGIGWYYTNWLSAVSNDTSLSTLDIGKMIADDFTNQCARRCPGQSTTLSLVDLAELSQTVPSKLNAFADDASTKISSGQYKEVSLARGKSKEFARGTGIDQVDLIHFARLLDSKPAKELADTISEAVKYNVTSSNTANAYGLSIYFPYKSLNKVDSMTNTYAQIGMDDDYTACIRKFAQMEVSGQAVGGGGTSPFEALMGTGSGSGSSDLSSQAMQQLINSLFSGGFTDFRRIGLPELDSSNTRFLSEDSLDSTEVASYISENMITADDLKWQKNKGGKRAIILSDDQWDLIKSADLNMLYDDGEGYVDLGLDNVYDFDDDGNLLPTEYRDWISLNGQPVAYYHTETLEKGDDQYVITGYVPVTLNGKDARLIISFDNENEDGYVAGVSYDYDSDEAETAAKTLEGLKKGDKVQFLCDFYSYEGNHKGSYKLGNAMTVNDPESISITNTDVGDGKVLILYKFTDIYGEEYWTPPIQM